MSTVPTTSSQNESVSLRSTPCMLPLVVSTSMHMSALLGPVDLHRPDRSKQLETGGGVVVVVGVVVSVGIVGVGTFT